MTIRAYLKRGVSAFLAFAIILGCIPAFEISLPSFATDTQANTPTYSVTVNASYDGTALGGATVTLTDAAGTTVASGTTAAATTDTTVAGQVVLTEVPDGTYTLLVKKVEDGYDKSAGGYTYMTTGTVTVDGDDKTLSVSVLRYYSDASVKSTYDRAKTTTTVNIGDKRNPVWVERERGFSHVDVRVAGSLTVEGQVQSVTIENVTLLVTYVNAEGETEKLIDTTYTSFTSYEWKTSAWVPTTALVSVTCDIKVSYTDENGDPATRTIEGASFTFSGEEAFKQAIYDCDAKQGLDFKISADEIMELVYHNVTYVWKIAIPVVDATTGEITGYEFIDMPEDLATVPTDDTDYATGENHDVDTVWQKGDTLINYDPDPNTEGEAPVKYTFRGWAVYTTDEDGHEQEFLIADLEELNKLPITADTIIYGVWTVEELTAVPGYILLKKNVSGVTVDDAFKALLKQNLVFTIKHPDGSTNQISYSQFDANGEFKYYVGASGTYTITETMGNIPGYTWNENDSTTKIERTIEITYTDGDTTAKQYGDTAEFTNNYTKNTGNPVYVWPSLRVAKMDTVTFAGLAEVTFTLVDQNSGKTTYITDTDGVFDIAFTKEGTYTLTETATIDGYYLNGKVYTVTVAVAETIENYYDASQDAYVTRYVYDVTVYNGTDEDDHFNADENRLVVYNDKTGSLAIEKEVAHSLGGSHTLPSGLKFTITVDLGASFANQTFDVNGYSTSTITANASGVITLTISPEQTVIISGIPEGTEAKVSEAQVPNYNAPVYRENGVSGDGVVTISRDTAVTVDVVNVYNPTYPELYPKNVTISGNKIFTGRANNAWLSTDSFTAKLQYWNGTAWEDVATRTMTGSNRSYEFDFDDISEIKYTAIGTYSYQVVEVIGSIKGVLYDRTVHTFSVNVGDPDMDGVLEITSVRSEHTNVEFDYNESTGVWSKTGADFTNTYSTSGQVAIDLDVRKILNNDSGAAIDLGQFGFVLTRDDGNYTETIYADQVGEATFYLSYTEAGTYVYTLKEVIPSDAVENKLKGMSYDGSVYTVRVYVSDNTQGGLKATVEVNGASFDIDNGELTFTNTYDPTDVPVFDNEDTTAPITIHKTLNGRDLQVGGFEFELLQYNPATKEYDISVATATNTADGTVSFNVTLSKVGVYYYLIRENDTGLGGVTYDTSEYHIKVTVTDDGTGVLKAEYNVQELTAPNTYIEFINQYEAAPTSAAIHGTKTLSDPHQTNRKLQAGEFSFRLYSSDGPESDWAVGRLLQTVQNDANGAFSFTQGLYYTAAGTYYYVVKEVSGSELGMSYDDSEYHVTVTVTDDGAGQLHASVKYDGTIAFVNTYHTGKLTISKELDPSVTADGYTPNAEQTFTILGRLIGVKAGTYPVVYEGVSETKTVTVDSNGYFTVSIYAGQTVEFLNLPAGTVAVMGEYQAPAGYTPSYYVNGTLVPDVQYVSVTVTDNAVASVVVMNDYEGAPVSTTINLSGTKKVDGTLTTSETFTFELQKWDATAQKWVTVEDSTVTVTVGAGEDQEASISLSKKLTFDKIGEYAFQFVEKDGGTTVNGMQYDATKHTFTVTVTDDNMDGQLEIKSVVSEHSDNTFTEIKNAETGETAYTNSKIDFTNTFKPTAAQVSIDVQKKLTNDSNSPLVSLRGFKFGLYDEDGNLVQGTSEAHTDAAGEAQILLTLNSVGTYTYYLKEIMPEGVENNTLNGMIYDSRNVKVVIVVTANDGVLSAAVTYDGKTQEEAEFTNTYDPVDAELPLVIKKVLTGRDMKAGEFTFDLYWYDVTTGKYLDKNGNAQTSEEPVAIDSKINGAAKAGEAAEIAFEKLTYSQVGTYYYVIKEQKGGTVENGVTYDATVYYVVVTVEDVGGELKASYRVGDLPGTEVIFTNRYQADSKQIVWPTVNKVLENKTLVGGEFTFQIKDKNGDIIGIGTNDAEGNVIFEETVAGAFTFTAAGEYTYTISEVIPEGAVDNIKNGIKYDADEVIVEYTVTDDGEGNLVVSRTVGAITFINTYTAASTSTDLAGQKIYQNGTLQGGDFEFGLYDAEGNLLKTVKNDAEGKFVFAAEDIGALNFTEAGAYKFIIKETNGGKFLSGVQYDSKEYGVTVYVRDNGVGALYVAGIFEDDAEARAALNLTFTNTYVKPNDINVAIDITKVVENKGNIVMGPEGFQFKLQEYVWDTETQSWVAARSALAISDAEGKALFELVFSEEHIGKQYKFEFSEVAGDVSDMVYDTTVHSVIFTVVRTEDNLLQAKVDGQAVESVAIAFNNEYNGNIPYTGDSGNPMLWIALLFVTGGVLAVLTVDSKRKQKNQ